MPKKCRRSRESRDRKGTGAQIEGFGSDESKGRPVSASRSEMVEAVLPNDANPLGYILGGRVMHLVDIAGAIAAHRHCA